MPVGGSLSEKLHVHNCNGWPTSIHKLIKQLLSSMNFKTFIRNHKKIVKHFSFSLRHQISDFLAFLNTKIHFSS